MYLNVLPHRLNGPRESLKYNVIDGEITYAEIAVAKSINSLLSLVELNKNEITLSSVDVNALEENSHVIFTDAFSNAFS